MHHRIITVILLIGLFFAAGALWSGVSQWRLPDREQGYAPVQPLDYSHRLHAGDLQIDCRFCHTGAEKGRYAGIPATSVCMKCHEHVKNSSDARQAAATQERDAETSPELQKLFDYLKRDQPIPWRRVHNLPDFVYFNHSAHVAAGVTCQHCHGPVETMERVRQHETLSMGWCVNCHRESTQNGVNGRAVNASNDCTVCHY